MAGEADATLLQLEAARKRVEQLERQVQILTARVMAKDGEFAKERAQWVGKVNKLKADLRAALKSGASRSATTSTR